MSVVTPLPASVTRERVAKALDPGFLPQSLTNLSSIRWREEASVDLWVWKAGHGSVDRRPTFAELNLSNQTFLPVRPKQSFQPLWSTHWVKVRYRVPEHWSEAATFLVFDCSCEAAVYAEDGTLLSGLTGGEGGAASLRGNRRVELPLRAAPGSTGILYIEVACNGLFGGDGALVGKVDPAQSFQLVTAQIAWLHEEGHALTYDMLLLLDLAEKAGKDGGQPGLAARALAVANAALNVVERGQEESYTRARQLIREVLRKVESGGPKTAQAELKKGLQVMEDSLLPRVLAVGHCHIDTAWLWPFAETRRKIARSWANQLKLMEGRGDGTAFGDSRFTFAASQACHYAWLREDHPALFARVAAAVLGGRFIPVGTAWTEFDANMPSGESMVRQLLYGARELQGSLGKEIVQAAVARASSTGQAVPTRVPVSEVFWLPDTFGYCPALPTILRGAGMRYFLTQKLSWSLENKPEHSSVWWTGLDGSSVLAHFPPADTYNAGAGLEDVLKSAGGNKDAGRSSVSLMLYGIGDGGGGPNNAMFEQLQRLGAASLVTPGAGVQQEAALRPLPGLPRVLHAHPTQFFDALAADLARAGGLDYDAAEWRGELYLELHNGTLTSQAGVKAGNRRAESALGAAELLASLAYGLFQDRSLPADVIAGYDYPTADLTAQWKSLLTCQFHDVLPGSCIGEVAKDAVERLAAVVKGAEGVQGAAREALVRYLAHVPTVDKDGKPSANERAKAFGGASEGKTGAAVVQARKVFRVWNTSTASRMELVVLPASEAAASAATSASVDPTTRSVLIGVPLPPLSVAEVPVDAAAALVAQVEKQRALLGKTGEDEGAQFQVLEPAQLQAAAHPVLGIPSPSLPDVGTPFTLPLLGRRADLPHPATLTRAKVYVLREEDMESYVIDTGVIRATMSRTTGHLTSLLDYRPDPSHPREVIAQPAGGSGWERTGQAGAPPAGTQGGNRLLLCDDTPFFWDAWDFFPYGLEKASVAAGGSSSAGGGWGVQTQVLEAGPLRVRVRVVLPTLGRQGSWLAQDVVFQYGSAQIDFPTTVEWRESHVMLQVEFPTTLRAQVATYETQYGCTTRPTHTNTSRDVMQHEGSVQRWHDISGPDYGVAVLNDCKYGASCRGGRLRLSLLRAPKAPDAACDMGRHVFTYSLLPHMGAVTCSSEVLAAASALNTPILMDAPALPVLQMARAQAMMARTAPREMAGKGGGAVAPPVAASGGAGAKGGPPARAGVGGAGAAASPGQAEQTASLAAVHKIRPPVKFRSLSFMTVSLPSDAEGDGSACCSVVLDAVKRAEDGQGWIVRLYEAYGRAGRVHLTCALPLDTVEVNTLLEEIPGMEGLPVESADASYAHTISQYGQDAFLAQAPPGVQAAFKGREGPPMPALAILEDACTVELTVEPFQLVCLRVMPAP